MLATYINQMTTWFGNFTADYLMPTMAGILVAGIMLKMLIYYLARGNLIISKEVEKRVHRLLDGQYPEASGLDFHALAKFIFNKTYNEHFIMRKKNMRRRLDSTASFLDRMFYVDVGTQALFEDTIKQAKYAAKEVNPNFKSVTSFSFTANPYFNYLFGLIPLRVINSVLMILPGLFIIGGIFGTFLGIVKGIPELKGINPENVSMAQTILGSFLDQMAFSMNTSIMGIFFSVIFTMVNALFSPKNLQREAFVKFNHALEFLWKNSKTYREYKNTHAQESSPEEHEIPPEIPRIPTAQDQKIMEQKRRMSKRERPVNTPEVINASYEEAEDDQKRYGT